MIARAQRDHRAHGNNQHVREEYIAQGCLWFGSADFRHLQAHRAKSGSNSFSPRLREVQLKYSYSYALSFTPLTLKESRMLAPDHFFFFSRGLSQALKGSNRGSSVRRRRRRPVGINNNASDGEENFVCASSCGKAPGTWATGLSRPFSLLL